MAVMGSAWLLGDLYGCYAVYVVVMGSMWLLWALCGRYRVCIPIVNKKSLCVALAGLIYIVHEDMTWHYVFFGVNFVEK